LAMSLFCSGPLSKSVIKIFCLTVRNIVTMVNWLIRK
jgi:hypothetical protein